MNVEKTVKITPLQNNIANRALYYLFLKYYWVEEINTSHSIDIWQVNN